MLHNTDAAGQMKTKCWDLKDTTCVEGQGSTKTNDSIS